VKTRVAPASRSARLERHVVAFMSGETPEVFHERLRGGAWGQPGGQDQVGMPWWSFDEVSQRLSPQRRAQLEEIAGQDLSICFAVSSDPAKKSQLAAYRMAAHAFTGGA
jgi:hypothetical protein